MAELSVKCPECAHEIKGPSELEVAKLAMAHMKEVHDKEVPLEEAQKMVKDMLQG